MLKRISFIILYILYFFAFYYYSNWWTCSVFLVVWASPISYKMNNIYETDIKAYKLIPNEIIKKYEVYHRKDVQKLSKCNLIIGGVFLFPLRVVFHILGLAIINLTGRLTTCGENLNEPPS